MSYSPQKPVQYALKAKTADNALVAVSSSVSSDGVAAVSFVNPNLTITKEDTTTVSTSLISLVPNTASYALTASFVRNAVSASYVLNAVSASYALTSSLAQTASYIDGGKF